MNAILCNIVCGWQVAIFSTAVQYINYAVTPVIMVVLNSSGIPSQ